MENVKQNGSGSILNLIKVLTIAANIIFVLWILINGINESFQGSMIEKISYISLMGLLSVNSFFLIRSRR